MWIFENYIIRHDVIHIHYYIIHVLYIRSIHLLIHQNIIRLINHICHANLPIQAELDIPTDMKAAVRTAVQPRGPMVVRRWGDPDQPTEGLVTLVGWVI